MKKALRTTGKIILVIIIILLLFLTGLFICNRVLLGREAELIAGHPGSMVEIDGHNMCIYTEGSTSDDENNSEHTIVFLSGSGTPSPIYDFKCLYSRLSDDSRIVVIEKFGYGFSDIVDTERSFDTMIRQDREALEKCGITGPFILCPHSMSGIEAILWAQEYPDEVEAIIGLDMTPPETYDVLDLKGAERSEALSGIAVQLGFLRIVNIEDMFPSFENGGLTDSEKDIYRAVINRMTCNKVIVNESKAIPEACEKIRSRAKPDVPTLMFISDGTGVDVEGWIQIEKGYTDGLTNAKTVELDCGHYVYSYEYERIAKDMKEFIGGLD